MKEPESTILSSSHLRKECNYRKAAGNRRTGGYEVVDVRQRVNYFDCWSKVALGGDERMVLT